MEENYHYELGNNQQITFIDIIDDIPDNFNHYETTFGEGEIHYKAMGGRVVEVIIKTTLGRAYADEKVFEFVDNMFI